MVLWGWTESQKEVYLKDSDQIWKEIRPRAPSENKLMYLYKKITTGFEAI